jgi:ABC-2 type transport system permease protein
MLWYKAWLETRTRFSICLAGILILCSYSVFHGERQATSWVDGRYYNYVLSEGHALLALMWVFAVILLMMGGLLREEALGAAPFTLALPVSRQKTMAVRIAAGAFQGLILAVLPWCAMYLVASILGKTFSLPQTAFHLLLLLTGGSVFFAVSLLASSTLSGEYTPAVASFGTMLAIAAMLGDKKLRIFSPLAFMMGTEYFNPDTNLLVGPFPWAVAAVWLSVAVLLTWIAVRVITKRDF